eukprot:4311315-Pyramimonas_sp.AAC.1
MAQRADERSQLAAVDIGEGLAQRARDASAEGARALLQHHRSPADARVLLEVALVGGAAQVHVARRQRAAN